LRKRSPSSRIARSMSVSGGGDTRALARACEGEEFPPEKSDKARGKLSG
jgi:hypothetical protein